MPYGSARDLPKFQEMQRQLSAMRLLRFLVPKDQRAALGEIPALLDHLVNTVDSFYSLLGDRNWVFHDDLSVPDMAELVSRNSANLATHGSGMLGVTPRSNNQIRRRRSI